MMCTYRILPIYSDDNYSYLHLKIKNKYDQLLVINN